MSSTLIRPSTSHLLRVDPDHVGLVVGVELVRQVPDECAEQVLDGQHALDPAVLVDHDGERPPLAPHLGEDVEHEVRLGDEEGLADPAGDVDRAGGSVAPVPVGRPASDGRNRRRVPPRSATRPGRGR